MTICVSVNTLLGMSASRVNGVSVIIPAYNGAQWIVRSIQSVLGQTTETPIEVIVVDDCSKDGTAELVKGMADARVRLVQTTANKGVAGARNVGIENARFEWVGFNDQDDIWLPRKLERQIELLDRHPEFCGVTSGAGRLAGDGRSQWSARLLFWKWTPVYIPNLRHPVAYDPKSEGATFLQTLLVARRALVEVGGFCEQLPLSDDMDLLMKISETSKLACVQEPLFLYRLGEDNQTAPGQADAVRFLAAHAYYEAAQKARTKNLPEPEVVQFMATYRPPQADIEGFHIRQGFRAINTKWVNRGTSAAALELGKQFLSNPKLFSRFVWHRLR